MPGLGSIGLPELLIVLVIIIIIFGVGKLPQVGGAIGKSIKEFRKQREGEEEKGKDVAKSTEAEKETNAESG